MKRNVLFITWDGPQVSYLDGLFLPIFRCLAEHGYQFHVLQFTWGSPGAIRTTATRCQQVGVSYRSLTVHRRAGALGALATAVLGARHIRRAIKDWSIDILLPRSLMPALAVLALRSPAPVPVLFDADGLAADEKVDFEGLSASSLSYRLLRDIEAEMLRVADGVITRTIRAVPILQARAGAGVRPEKFRLVSNGIDASRFVEAAARVPDDPIRLCFAGSMNARYCPETMVHLAVALRERFTTLEFWVFTREGDSLRQTLREMNRAGETWIHIEAVDQRDMPGRLAQCDIALSFRQPTFSTQAVEPVKNGEYFLAGLPVIGSAHVGGLDEAIEAGYFLPSDGRNVDEVTAWVAARTNPSASATRLDIQALGRRRFSLETSVRQYLAALLALPTAARPATG